MNTEQGEARIGNLVPREHESRMRTFVLMRGVLPIASGVQFTDGRLAVVHRDGREELHPDIDHLTREYVGMAGLVWDRPEKWETGCDRPRRFVFLRHKDVSGFSGEGVALEGAEFPDGRVVLAWLGPFRSVVHWPDMGQAIACHGHQGSTTVAWLDGVGDAA